MNPPPSISLYLSTIGRRGGQAGRGKSKARTTEQARAAAMVRWAKQRKETAKK